jgi:hypothetical protein
MLVLDLTICMQVTIEGWWVFIGFFAPIPLDCYCASSVEVCVTLASVDLGSNSGVHCLHSSGRCGVAHWHFCVLFPSHEGMLHHGSTCH